MKIEIWSDFMCPFCYIGKRKFETALAQFPGKDKVEVNWKSYQLDPSIPIRMEKPVNVYDYLAERKGMSHEDSVSMHSNVVEMARQAGLSYNFDKAVVGNTFDAHRLSHFAKERGLQAEMEEVLFKAYFTEGKNIADHIVLAELGQLIGLNADEIKKMLNADEYGEALDRDIQEASQLRISGVPFFVFDRKIGVSGAQDPSVFLEAMEKAKNG